LLNGQSPPCGFLGGFAVSFGAHVRAHDPAAPDNFACLRGHGSIGIGRELSGQFRYLSIFISSSTRSFFDRTQSFPLGDGTAFLFN
jgi:hypothetical protein